MLASVYDRDAGPIATAIEMLLSHEHLNVEDIEVVAAVVARCRGEPRVGFSDCLMVESAQKAGHTPLGTCDRDLGNPPNYRRYDLHAVRMMGANIELWAYRVFTNRRLGSRRLVGLAEDLDHLVFGEPALANRRLTRDVSAILSCVPSCQNRPAGQWDDFFYPSCDDACVFPEEGASALSWSHGEFCEFITHTL